VTGAIDVNKADLSFETILKAAYQTREIREERYFKCVTIIDKSAPKYQFEDFLETSW
jgi:hypothetical protein